MTIFTGAPLSWAITATAGSGFLLFGYDQGVMSGLLTGDAFIRQFPEIDTTLTGKGSSSLQGTVVAIYEIGCFFGSLFCFLFGERLGRRKCIMIGCVVLSIGAALQASANTIPHLIVGRIVAGLGNGMNTSTIPVWHAELMKAHKRGKGLAVELAINIFGVMMAYWVDYGFSFVNSAAQFRVPLALQIVFAVVTLAGILVLPESPRWLLAHDKHEEARHILWALELNAKSIEPSDAVIHQEMAEIQHAIYEERAAAEGSGGKRALLKNGPQRFLYRTLLGIGSQFMQQLSGINLITYYAPVIFETSVGLSHSVSLLLSGFNGVAYFLSSLIPIWLIDRLGRRKLMLFAAAGQAVCMAILAGTISNGSTSAGYVATVMLFLFNFFFAVGLLAIPWLLPAEYAPLAIRTPAASLASASNWIFTFLVVEITPVSIDSIKWKTYIYFAVFNACFLPLIYFFYPETKNLTLEQIDELFTGEKVLLHWKESMAATDLPQDDLRAKFGEKTNVEHIDNSLAKSYVCDELRPECMNCHERGERCKWGMKITFRTNNATNIDPEHPSMQEGSKRRARHFKIVDVTSQVEKGSRIDAGIDDHPEINLSHTHVAISYESPYNNKSLGENMEPLAPVIDEPSMYHSQLHSESPSLNTPNSMTVSYPDDNSFREDNDQYMQVGASRRSETSVYHRQASSGQSYSDEDHCISNLEAEHMTSPNHDVSSDRTDPEGAASDLLALRYLQQSKPATAVSQVSRPPPDIRSNLTDINQAQMLEHGVFDNHQDGIFLPGSEFQEFHSTLRDHLIYTARSNCPTRLDKFDNKRHFEHKIPTMARKIPHLKNSMLALSARQIEMKETSESSSESLGLYQEAIHLLLPELQSRDTAVIASCVILCVLEMMSYLCGALISQDITLIPVTRWASNVDFSSDVKLFRNPDNGFDTYANYAVFLCANCVAYLKACKGWAPETQESRWIELINLLDDWYTVRPEEMRPIFSISLNEGNIHRPFPTVFLRKPIVSYSNVVNVARKARQAASTTKTKINILACPPDMCYLRVKYTSRRVDKFNPAHMDCGKGHESPERTSSYFRYTREN
ncbi:sugar transporter Stl1 [Botrytis cinerea]